MTRTRNILDDLYPDDPETVDMTSLRKILRTANLERLTDDD